MEVLGIIFVAAVLVEAVTNAIKPIWDAEKRGVSWPALVSLAVGMVVAFAADLDIAGAVGVAIEWPVVPQLITGIIIGRGANYVHDIVKRMRGEALEIIVDTETGVEEE